MISYLLVLHPVLWPLHTYFILIRRDPYPSGSLRLLPFSPKLYRGMISRVEKNLLSKGFATIAFKKFGKAADVLEYVA